MEDYRNISAGMQKNMEDCWKRNGGRFLRALNNKEIKKRSKVVGEDFAPLFMHLKEKNGQKMKHM